MHGRPPLADDHAGLGLVALARERGEGVLTDEGRVRSRDGIAEPIERTLDGRLGDAAPSS